MAGARHDGREGTLEGTSLERTRGAERHDGETERDDGETGRDDGETEMMGPKENDGTKEIMGLRN